MNIKRALRECCPVVMAIMLLMIGAPALFLLPNIFEGDKFPSEKKELQAVLLEEENCRGFKAEAAKRAEEFLVKMDIGFKNPPYVKDYFTFGASGADLPEAGERPIGAVLVSFENPKEEGKGDFIRRISLSVGCRSKEVEKFASWEVRKLVHTAGDGPGRYAPEPPTPKETLFMDKEKALKRTLSLAEKLHMPSDMVFGGLDRNERDGLWQAAWSRAKDGYPYEGDSAVLSINGTTGEFAGFKKTYLGMPCPTEAAIEKEKAEGLGRKRLLRHIPKKAKEYYKADGALMIVRTDGLMKSHLPLKWNGSSLAWVMHYYFTGGQNFEVAKFTDAAQSTERSKAVEEYLREKYKTWHDFGEPPLDFEVRIEAKTGKILYETPVMPRCLKWIP